MPVALRCVNSRRYGKDADAGVVLGAGTVVAPMRRGALDWSGEERSLALLSIALSAPVDAALLGKLRRAGRLWRGARRASPISIWRSSACRRSTTSRRSGSSSLTG